MVKLGPPDSVFDGLDIGVPEDRIAALTRLVDVLGRVEKTLIKSSDDAECEVPSAKQLDCLWRAVATVSSGVRAVAKVIIAEGET